VASWRAVAGAAVIAITATAGVASIVGASPTQGAVAAASTSVGAISAQVDAPAVLPAVTQHPVDPAVLAVMSPVPRSTAQSVTQTVQLTIVGGPLELVTTEADVALERVAGSERDWVGTLPPVRVVDARGTHEGWRVRWDATAVSADGGAPRGDVSGKVRVEAASPEVVAGVDEGVVAGTGRTLFSAERGAGGGTYEAGATVSLRLPPSVDPQSVVVHLVFSLS
jgi:hypothetical protein